MVIYQKDSGQFIQGLPARDMSMAEWQSYPKELRDLGLSCGAYKLPEKQAAKVAAGE